MGHKSEHKRLLIAINMRKTVRGTKHNVDVIVTQESSTKFENIRYMN